ncbi:MAG TPA: metallophosphoesterase family protein [Gaiellaceae bacterium]|jgi:diadenosine tetraphosphatase ApaH/serine/threonine PP2A family protein phosphatase
MRIAVLSDIHANLHALEAVLADVDSVGPDEIWCLGDTVGYGAAPNECCERIRDRADVMLCGNHDLAVIGTLDLAEFSGEAAVAARWTQTVLEEQHRSWLATLEPQLALPTAELFHASPRDPVWDYVLSEEVGRESLELTTAPLVLVGHSHVALALSLDGDDIEGGLAPDGAELELDSGRWLANPGSVGQPRDGDPHAAWLLVDFGAKRAGFRRIAYDVEGAQAQIRAAGLPDALAGRLAYGL